MKLTKEFWEKRLGEEWTMKLRDTLRSDYAGKLINFLNKEYTTKVVYPKREDIFRAFRLTPFSEVKVVILGKDPYPDGKANGLAFSNREDALFYSPSLTKIFDFIEREYHDGLTFDFDFTLEEWARQGVLLLNTSLTVERLKIGSHHKPWKKFTKAVIDSINEYHTGVVFMLWGNDAKAFKPLIAEHHHILTHVHPAYSWRNRDAWECPNFKQCDEILMKANGDTIRW
jgi:uracil-DNA glycosylase